MNEPGEGFTLIELLVVLVIIGVAGAVVLPFIRLGAAGEVLREEGTEIVKYLRKAHKDAVLRGHRVVVEVDGKARRLWRCGDKALDLAEGVKICCSAEEIVFFPDGTATERKLSLASDEGGVLRIGVNPFTGLAKIEQVLENG